MALTAQARAAVPGVGRPWMRSNKPGTKNLVWRKSTGLTLMGEFVPTDTTDTIGRTESAADGTVACVLGTDTTLGRTEAPTDGTVGFVPGTSTTLGRVAGSSGLVGRV